MFSASDSLEGYYRFKNGWQSYKESKQKDLVFVDCELIGHYWFVFVDYFQGNEVNICELLSREAE